MNTTHSINLDAIGITEMLKGSGTIISRLSKTHEAKVKVIIGDDNMSTQEKLDALDENDYQLIRKWLAVGVCAATVVVMVGTGRIDFEGVRRIGQAIAA